MRLLITYIYLFFFTVVASAQQAEEDTIQATRTTEEEILVADSVVAEDEYELMDLDYPYAELIDTINREMHILTADSVIVPQEQTINPQRWIPDPKKAMWLAIVFPGGGQIYNRKYWKLPLIYGGFIGCIYALSWNGSMYRDYSQAYMDIMDNDPNTKSYENFLPATYDVQGRLEYLQNLFKRKKNYFRRYRDLSLFCMIGVYLLSIVDAYVDAELSSFDITKDLTMKIRPSIFNGNNGRTNLAGGMNRSDMNGSSYGFQCSLNF